MGKLVFSSGSGGVYDNRPIEIASQVLFSDRPGAIIPPKLQGLFKWKTSLAVGISEVGRKNG
jgi:hypothetical protein